MAVERLLEEDEVKEMIGTYWWPKFFTSMIGKCLPVLDKKVHYYETDIENFVKENKI